MFQIILATSCRKKRFRVILVQYHVYFTLINVKKVLKTYKMYMKTLIYLISKIRYLILAMKGQNSWLIKHHYVFRNETNKQSAPSFSKTALSIFQLKSDC